VVILDERRRSRVFQVEGSSPERPLVRRERLGKRDARVMYQLGWTTLPGLRGLSVSEFRATPTVAPDNEKGVALEFANEADRDSFLQQLEADFAPRRFTNAADAFDTVKACVLERAAKGNRIFRR
jgi:hypothetical protein